MRIKYAYTLKRFWMHTRDMLLTSLHALSADLVE